MLTKDAPAKLTLPVLFSDGMLARSLTQGLVGPSVQAMLLLGDDPKKALLAEAKEPTLAEPAQIEGRDCYRVQIPRPEGTVVLWIDAETFALRRMVPPTDELQQRMEQDGERRKPVAGSRVQRGDAQRRGGPEAVRLRSAQGRRSGEILHAPGGEALGRKGAGVQVHRPRRQADHARVAGQKVVVLDFWASWCEPCRESLPYLERVYQKYKDNAKVAFVAVSVDKPDVTDKDLEAVFKKLKVHLPIARDLKRSADALRFATIPTTFLLGADGVVQYFDDRGPDPNVSKESAGVVGPPAGREERLPDVV